METFGEACIRIARAETWVRETEGSNRAPRIRQYFEPCVREKGERRDGDLQRLGLTEGQWCAAFACWCATQAMQRAPDAGWAPPHHYRASGVELVRDALERGAWHPVEEFRGGEWSPWRGDLVIWRRDGGHSWNRHVNRLVEFVDTKWELFATIGGNEENRVREAVQRMDDPDLLGFISYHQRGKGRFT